MPLSEVAVFHDEMAGLLSGVAIGPSSAPSQNGEMAAWDGEMVVIYGEMAESAVEMANDQNPNRLIGADWDDAEF